MLKIRKISLIFLLKNLVGLFLLNIIIVVSIYADNSSKNLADLNVAVVDTAYFQQNFLTDIEVKLKKEFDKKDKELQELAKELENEKNKLQKDKTIMTQEAAEKLTSSFMEKQAKFQQKAAQYQQEAQVRQQEELTKRSEILMKAVDKVSKNKYDFVIAKGVFLYVKNNLDITEEVKKQYDKDFK